MAIITAGFENGYIYNNILYRILSSFTHGMIRVSTSNGTRSEAPARNVKIKNNIFYVKSRTYSVIEVHKRAMEGFECDYNFYYCEEGNTNEDLSDNGDKIISWDEWRERGSNEHSANVNPSFTDTIRLTPGRKLDCGINVGPEYNTGLSLFANWYVDKYPETKMYNGRWQLGTYIN